MTFDFNKLLELPQVTDARIHEGIRMMREAQNMTQSDLAVKAGISMNEIANFESGREKLGMDTIMKMFRALSGTVN